MVLDLKCRHLGIHMLALGIKRKYIDPVLSFDHAVHALFNS